MIFDTLQNVNPGKPDMQAMGGGGGMSAISGMFNRGQQQRAPFAGAMDWMRQRFGQQQGHQMQMPGNTGIVPPNMGGGFEGMGRPQAPGGFNGMNTFQQPQQMQQLQNPMRWG